MSTNLPLLLSIISTKLTPLQWILHNILITTPDIKQTTEWRVKSGYVASEIQVEGQHIHSYSVQRFLWMLYNYKPNPGMKQGSLACQNWIWNPTHWSAVAPLFHSDKTPTLCLSGLAAPHIRSCSLCGRTQSRWKESHDISTAVYSLITGITQLLT